MPIFTVRHVTTYSYKRAVGFGEHRMMLRPRDDGDQTVVDLKLDIAPVPAAVAWSHDAFGNHVGSALFAERAKELRFDSTVRLEHQTSPFDATTIAPRARTFPFAYTGEDREIGDDENCASGGNTHAWVQVFVPGLGWVDFDPSSGSTGNENLVRVAVVRRAGEAIPLQGTWIGSAADHLAMNVAVKVTPAAI